jgi:hypothetical protein
MKKHVLALSIAAVSSAPASAFQFDTPSDWEVRWDNTFKANVMVRVEDQNKDVYEGRRGNTAGFLADDSDLGFDQWGIVSSRIDILSEFDVVYKQNFGFRWSLAGWYDHAYRDSDHPGNRRQSWASPSVDPGEFTRAAEKLHYFGGETLDAFAFGSFDIGDTVLGLRAGRHTIYWGNSLLAIGAIHGVGGAMAPLDFAKAFSVPGTEAKELFLPATKLSGVWQLTNNLTLNAYYSFEHRRYRFSETGTYFSPAEGLTEDTEFVTIAPGDPFRTGLDTLADQAENKEYGFNVQYYFENLGLETSFIYLNYVDKNIHGLHAGNDLGQLGNALAGAGDPQAAALIALWNAQCSTGAVPCPNAPVVDPDAGTVSVGEARWLFKEDIDLFGLSFAKEIGGVSVGADIVFRQDTGLAPDLENSLGRFYNSPSDLFTQLVEDNLGLVNIPGDFRGYDSKNYLGPTGDAWSVVINGLGLLSPSKFWDGGSYVLEGTFSWVDKCKEQCNLLDRDIDEGEVAVNLAFVFKPTWYQVRPGWDMSMPISFSMQVDGEQSPFSVGGDLNRGNASVGLEFNINETWNFTARYNAFFGPVTAGIAALLKDRDNVSFTLKRTI